MVFSEITGFGNYCSLRPETLQMQTTLQMSFHDDLILQDQASGEDSQDQWSSGLMIIDYLPWVLIERTRSLLENRLCVLTM